MGTEDDGFAQTVTSFIGGSCKDHGVGKTGGSLSRAVRVGFVQAQFDTRTPRRALRQQTIQGILGTGMVCVQLKHAVAMDANGKVLAHFVGLHAKHGRKNSTSCNTSRTSRLTLRPHSAWANALPLTAS
jgi:hypothetical protein